ncbi:MAG: hypothetical protein Q9161_008378 [Pseudevernia consocians]
MSKVMWTAEVTKETLDALKRDLVTQHKEEINSEANKQAKEDYEKEMFKHVENHYKGKLMREIGEEWKARETEKIKAAVKQEYEARFRSLLG